MAWTLLLLLPALAGESFFVPQQGRETPRQPVLRELAVGFLGWDDWGSRMITAGAEGLSLRDPNGRELRRLPCAAAGPTNPAREAAFTPDGSRAAVLTASGELCAWNLDGLTPLLLGGGRGWSHIDLGPDFVAVGRVDGTIEVRDLATGARRWRRNLGHGAVTAVRLSADASRLAAGFDTRGAAVFDPRSGRLIRAFSTAPVRAVDFHPTSPELVIGLDGGVVERWDTVLWRSVDRRVVGDAAVVDLDYRRAGDLLAIGTAAADETAVVVWSFEEDGEVLREPPRAPGSRVLRVRFNAQGDELVATDGRDWSALWRRPTRAAMPFRNASYEPPLHREPRGALPSAWAPVDAPSLGVVEALLPGDRGVVTRAADGARVVRRLDGGGGARLLESAGLVGPLVTTTGGDRLAGWSTDGWLRVWEVETGVVRAKVEAPRPRALAWGGGRLVLVDEGGAVRVGAGATWKLVAAAPAEALSVDVDPAGRRVVVGTRDGGVAVFPLAQAAPARVSYLHAGPVVAVAISADGQRVASVSVPPGGVGARVAFKWVEDRGPEEVPVARVETVPDFARFGPGLRLLLVSRGGVQVVDGEDGSVHLDWFGPTLAAGWDGELVRVVDAFGRVRSREPHADPLVPHLYGRILARTGRGRRVATLDGDVLSVWDGVPARLRRTGRPIGQEVREARFNRRGSHLALRYADGRVEVLAWEAETATPLPAPAGGASDWVGFSPDGERVWSFEGPRELVARDVGSGEVAERRVVPGEGRLELEPPVGPQRIARVYDGGGTVGWVDLASPSPFGFAPVSGARPLAVRPDDKVVAWLDPATGELRRRAAGTGLASSPAILPDEGRAIVAAAWAEDGQIFVVMDRAGYVRVLDDFGVLGRLEVGSPPRFGGEFGPPVVIEPGLDGVVATWDAQGRRRVFRQAAGTELPREADGALAVLPPGPLGPVADAPGAGLLLVGGADGVVRVLNVADGTQRGILLEHGGAITALDVTEDGRFAASAGADAAVWGYTLGDFTGVLPAPTFGDVGGLVAVSEDGSRVAALGPASLLRTWVTEARRPGARWRLPAGTGDRATGLEWRDPGRLCLAAGEERCVGVSEPAGSGVAAAPRGLVPATDPALEPWLGLRAEPAGAPHRVGELLVVPTRDGRLVAWDLPARAVRWVYTGYTDGSWVVDRGDGERISSVSLWDGSAPRVSGQEPLEE